MPDVISINTELNLIEVRSTGVVRKNDILSSIAKIIEIHKETGLNKVLVDTTRQASMPMATEAFEIFSNWPPELKLAFLTRPQQPTEEDIIFAETVGVNRSGRMKIFQDQSAAIEWLNAD
jgi:hypothetical protein